MQIIFGLLFLNFVYAPVHMPPAPPSNTQTDGAFANYVATRIGDAMHERRYGAFVESLSTVEMHSSVTAALKTARSNQAALVNNLPPKTPRHVRQFESDKLAVLNNLDADTHLTNIRDAVAGEKRFSTVSVMFYDNDLYISANVKTLEMPSAPDDAAWIQKAYRPKEGLSVEWKATEFGMQSADGGSIGEVLKGNQVKLPRPAEKVFIVSPQGNHDIERLQQSVFEAEHRKIMDTRDKKLHQVETSRKFSTQQKQAQTEQIEMEYEQSLAKAHENVGKDVAAVYHAEVVHVTHHKMVTDDKRYNYLSYNERNPNAERPLLGTSKPLCHMCENYVKQQNVFDFDQPENQPGLDFEKIQNWGVPRDVVLQQVDLDEITPSVDHNSNHKLTSDGVDSDTIPNGCSTSRRRRRGASSPCVFYVGKDKSWKWTSVEEIDSDAFMNKYADSDPNTRLQMSKGAAAAKEATVFGPDPDVDDVSKIVLHEEIKTHEKSLQKATDSMLQDELNVDSSNARLSPTTTAKQMSSGMKEFVAVGEAAQDAVGKILLIKSIVQGMATGDATGLGIMAGRYAGSWILKHGAKHASDFVAKMAVATTAKFGIKAGAEFTSKALAKVSQYAGPIGAVIDIGFNAWHLSSAVKRLNNPNATKWERNDAIADIVKSSADIVITSVATIASLAFPPFAPLFAVVGFFVNLFVSTAVAIYKAQNHVNMLDSKIPLLGFEKREEFTRNFMGKDTSAYIKNLIDTKNANNIFVNVSIQLMEQNPDIIGHVYPSRTVELMANCKLMRKHCPFSLFGCWKPEKPVVEAADCFQGRMCGDRICEYDIKYLTMTHASWNEWTCECPGGVGIKTGDPVRNQVVDFRNQRNLYLDRSRPDKPYLSTYEELCRPGSQTNKGYKYSEETQSYEYLCEGAIATIRRDRSGKYMLYELDDGFDFVWVFPFEYTHNRFMIANGHKQFYGGIASDTFIVAKCDYLTGILEGGSGDNVLIFTNGCKNDLTIDLVSEIVTGGGGKVRIDVKHVDSVYGRNGTGETIIAGCTTKYIAGSGGATWSLDRVTMASVHGCVVNVTVVADSYTTVEGGGEGVQTQIVIPRNTNQVTVTPLKYKPPGGVAALIKHGYRELYSATTFNKSGVKLFFGANELSFEFALLLNILLEESQGVPAQIILQGNIPKCLHQLGLSSGYRYGCPNTPNLYDIKGHGWSITGGLVDDEFNVAGHVTSGTFDGSDGIDGIYIPDNFGGDLLSVDMATGLIKGSDILMKSVEAFYGRWNKTDVVVCSCSTSVVSSRGGPSKQAPDEILTNPKCTHNLTLEVTSFSNIVALQLNGVLHVYVSQSARSESTLTLNMAPDGDTLITLPFPVHALQIEKRERNGHLLIIHFNGSSAFQHLFKVNLSFVLEPPKDNEFMTNFRVNLNEQNGLSSLMVPYDTNKNLMSFHTLQLPTTTSQGTRKGHRLFPNYFQIVTGNWDVIGGDEDDVFEIQSVPSGSLSGRLGTNDIRLTSPKSGSTGQQVTVDLHTQVVSSSGKRAKLKNIHRFFGDDRWHETIWIGCTTQLIVTGGNSLNTMDKVGFKGTPCPQNGTRVHIRVTGFTRLEAPTNASFTAHVPFSNKSLQFDLNAHLGTNSSKTIFLQTHPHELISCTQLNQEDKKISSKFSFGTEQHVIVTLSDQISNSSEDFFQNIHIIFTHPNATNVSRASLRFQRKNHTPLVMHEIEKVYGKETLEVIKGAIGVPNYFHIGEGAAVKVIGGAQDDTFYVSGSFSGGLVGGGGVNTIIPSCSTPVVNFATGEIACNSSFLGTLENIQVGKGHSGVTETFVIGCDTKSVATGGGVSAQQQDLITIGNLSDCQNGPQTTIYVEGATRINNSWIGAGSFVYVIPGESPFQIVLPPKTKASHVVRFQFGVNRVKSVKLINNLLKLELLSGKSTQFPIYKSTPDNPRYNNPKIGFEKGNDRLDFSLDEKLILATFTIFDDTLPFLGGIPGVRNDFTVNVTRSARLKSIRGADLDDHFHLVSIHGLRNIDGLGGTKNQLTLSALMAPGSNIKVDLRPNGSLQINSSNAAGNVQLRNIQIAIGRGSDAQDTIFISCDTLVVTGFQLVVITKQNCDFHTNTLIYVDANTNVLFKLEKGNSVFSNQTFHYKITSLRSFDLDSELWMSIRHTEQIFHLPFNIGRLEALYYFNGRLYYELNGLTYSHQVDTFFDWFQEFYANPQFQTEDGFQIKITRHGEIVIVSTIAPWSPVDDDTIATRYMDLSSRLRATFIIHGQRNNSFLYAGHSQTRNVLTNSPSRSLLLGGGSNLTLYTILDLSSDVKIYPGFLDDDSIHTVDMTLVVMPVRKGSKNHTKYVPRVIPGDGGNLEVVVQGYDGRVILVNGTGYANRIRILLEAVMMTIDNNKLVSKRNSRRTRSLNDDWYLKPSPLIVSEEWPVAVMSLQDLEIGQEIIFLSNDTQGEKMSVNLDGNTNDTSLRFQAYRNNDKLVLSTLAVASQFNRMLSITLLDAFKFPTEMLESIVVLNNDTDEFPKSLSDLQHEAFSEDKEDWEDTLEKVEYKLLQNLPYVPRQFQMPLHRSIWKRHRAMVIALFIGFILMLCIILVYFLCKFGWFEMCQSIILSWFLRCRKLFLGKEEEICISLIPLELPVQNQVTRLVLNEREVAWMWFVPHFGVKVMQTCKLIRARMLRDS